MKTEDLDRIRRDDKNYTTALNLALDRRLLLGEVDRLIAMRDAAERSCDNWKKRARDRGEILTEYETKLFACESILKFSSAIDSAATQAFAGPDRMRTNVTIGERLLLFTKIDQETLNLQSYRISK